MDEGSLKNNILIIAAMHRTGSSLISQWLFNCGLHMGETFVGPEVSNVDGHFEDITFFRLHEQLLQENNLPANGLINNGNIELTQYQKEKIRSLIELKNLLHAQWGWKEPRTCLFLNTYAELIPMAYYIVIARDFRHVVSSMVNRLFKDKEKNYKNKKFISKIWWNVKKEYRRMALYRRFTEHYLKVWIAYTHLLIGHCKKLDSSSFIVIDIPTLLSHDKAIFDHLTQIWKFDLTYYSFNNIYKESYLSSVVNIEPYVHSKSLLRDAECLQNELNGYIFKTLPAVFTPELK